jgi:hypothetical protein
MGARPGPKPERFSDDERAGWRDYVTSVLRDAGVTREKFSETSADLFSREDSNWAAKALRPQSKPTIKIARQVVYALYQLPMTAASFERSDLAQQPARKAPRWFADPLRDRIENEELWSKVGYSDIAATVILSVVDWQMWKIASLLSVPLKKKVRKRLLDLYVQLYHAAKRRDDEQNAVLSLFSTIPYVENETLSPESSALAAMKTWEQIGKRQRDAAS